MAEEIAAGRAMPMPPMRSLAHLPPAHLAGVMSYIVAPPLVGGTVFWIPKYNWPDFLRLAGQRRISAIYTVPSIYLRMAKDPAVRDQFKHLISASAGAAHTRRQAAGRRGEEGRRRARQPDVGPQRDDGGAVTAMSRGTEPDLYGEHQPAAARNVELRFVDERDNVRLSRFPFSGVMLTRSGRGRGPARRDTRARAHRDKGLPQQPRGDEGRVPQRLDSPRATSPSCATASSTSSTGSRSSPHRLFFRLSS